MKYQIGNNIQIMLMVLLVILISTPVLAQDSEEWRGAADSWFIYTVVIVVLVGAFLAIAFIRAAVSSSTTKWSLAEALSEEVTLEEIPKGEKDPKKVTRLCASTSRLIALMGMMVLLLMFIGFGTFALYSFGKTGKIPSSIDKVVKFLLAGLTLFAPYTVNKFASVFESLSPKASGQ
jgi:hypothetical protein